MFSVTMDTDNAAFCDQQTGEPDKTSRMFEVTRILNEVRVAVRAGLDHGTCIDYNGNKVGEWRFEE